MAAYGLATFYSIEDFHDIRQSLGEFTNVYLFLSFFCDPVAREKIMKSEVAAMYVTISQMISASVFLTLYMLFFGDITLPFKASSGTLMTFYF